MITKTVIAKLKDDALLQGLLDATSSSDCPIQAMYVPESMPSKLVIVGVVFGESFHQGYDSGIITLDVFVKDNVLEPIKVLTDITDRINEVLDMKGSQLQDSHTSLVFRLRRVDFNHLYDNVTHYHIGSIDFEYYVTR